MHDRHFQAQTDPSSSFHVGVCDAAASDPRRAAGKHKAQPISASGDHWIIYVPSHPLWQSCLLTGVRGLLRMPATLLAAVAGELPLNCNESPGSTVVFCTFIYFLFFCLIQRELISVRDVPDTRSNREWEVHAVPGLLEISRTTFRCPNSKTASRVGRLRCARSQKVSLGLLLKEGKEMFGDEQGCVISGL